MKKIAKTMLIAVMAVMMMMAVSLTASAATKKITVTYKKKTVTVLSTSLTYKAQKKLMYTTLKNKWGKRSTAKTTKRNGLTINEYTWKKGKSSVKLIDNEYHVSYTITIRDKNMKLNGMYVGMSKSAAMKIIKKNFRIMDTDDSSASKVVAQPTIGGPLEVSFKSGKVSKIYFFAS